MPYALRRTAAARISLFGFGPSTAARFVPLSTCPFTPGHPFGCIGTLQLTQESTALSVQVEPNDFVALPACCHLHRFGAHHACGVRLLACRVIAAGQPGCNTILVVRQQSGRSIKSGGSNIGNTSSSRIAHQEKRGALARCPAAQSLQCAAAKRREGQGSMRCKQDAWLQPAELCGAVLGPATIVVLRRMQTLLGQPAAAVAAAACRSSIQLKTAQSAHTSLMRCGLPRYSPWRACTYEQWAAGCGQCLASRRAGVDSL